MAKKIKYVGSKAVNKDSLSSFSVFNDSYQTSIFNGNIQLSTKFSTNQNINREKRIVITQKNVSLSDLKISDLDELNNFIKITDRFKLNLDRVNLSNYAVYGSLKEKFRITINNIINKFPGGLFINNFLTGITYYNILDYNYDETTALSSFRVPVTIIENPFILNLYQNGNLSANTIDNLTQRYLDYVLNYNNIDYAINGFTGFSTSNSSYLYFSIFGDPFASFSASSVSETFIVKPNDIEFNKFYDSLSELERYFLNKNSTPKYTFEFKIPEVNDSDELIYTNYKFSFPVRYDGYNLDTESITYSNFLEKLFEIGDLYDEYKSNLIIRKFIPKTLIDLDTTSSYKSESMFKIYGKEIDEIKMFIDSLMNINTVTYDKVSNISDVLIKNLARTLGWKARNIINDKDLLSSVFANDKTNDVDINASLAEVDIELWRRLVINTSWFLKSKGTRKSIETIFSFIGAPECLISFDEHVYVVDGKIDVKLVDPNIFDNKNSIIKIIPYDDDGYPVAPQQSNVTYFQANGNEDNGQYYINLYRKLGFNVTKTIDNKKSWVYYESASTHSSTGRNTNYVVKDSRLIINTKEVTINIDASRAIECDVYDFNQQYNYPVSSTGRTSPYPQRDSNKIDTTKLTFSEYINQIYSAFINVQNRKVSDSAVGSYYPSLTQLYYDYLNNSYNDIGQVSNKRRYLDLLKYVDNIDSIFDDFLKQFIPATTIFGDGTTNVRNTVFTPQKFVYKQGIDDGSEFESTVTAEPDYTVSQNLVLIQTEFFDNYEDTIALATISTEVKTSDNGNVDTPNYAYALSTNKLEPLSSANICEFEKSRFLLTGATKIELSSLTNNSLYDKSVATGQTILFHFTSATDTLTASTTEFYYSVHKYNNSSNILGFDDTPIYIFSATSAVLTSVTLSSTISDSLISCDSEYLIKPYFKFTGCPDTGTTFSASSPYTIYDSFIISGFVKNYTNAPLFYDYTTYTGNTGSTVSTLISKNNYTPTFNNYNYLDDYYFVSTCSAKTASISFPTGVENQGLYVQNIVVNVPEYSKFLLDYEPVGELIVSVNGITLQKGLEYDLDNTIVSPSFNKRLYKLNQRLTNAHNDVLNVTYYRNTTNSQKLIKEDFTYTGSSNISYNNITSKYEVDLSYSRIQSTDVLLYWNGLLMTKNTDYSLSVYNQNKIVLNFAITDPSTISVVYFVNSSTISNTTIDATGPSYTIEWYIDSIIAPPVQGKFIHQFYDLTNTGFTGSTLYSATTDYSYNSANYSKTFTWTDTDLIDGTTYLYRIASEKNFTTINNINLSSTTYSTVYNLKLPV